jgi:hypothetical protein
LGRRRGSPEDIVPARGEHVEREGGTACYQHSGEVAGGSGCVDNGVVGKLGRPGGLGLGLMPGGAGQWRSTTVNVVRVVRLSPAGKQSFTRSGAKPSQWGSVNVQ